MPAFDSRVSDFEAANTQVLGISTDSPFSHDNWAKSVGISNYPLLSDIHRTVAKDYGVRAVPQTFFIDADGTIRERVFGITSAKDLDQTLQKILHSSQRK